MNKPKTGMVCGVLLAILLLACVVCALHWVNAVSLRGTAVVNNYTVTDGSAENLVPLLEDLWLEHDVLHIRGALLRLDQPVGKVNVRVGLIPETKNGSNTEVILLNTQLVRRFELAKMYKCDDHCGFHAVTDIGRLLHMDTRFSVVLVDESDENPKLVQTGLIMAIGEDAPMFERMDTPQEEAKDAQ